MDSTIQLSPPVDTVGGKVRGYYDRGIYTFKNVLYAKAERFEPPYRANWKGIRMCLSYGYAPPLLDRNEIANDFYNPHYYWSTDEEECLNLNVWTPGLDGQAKRPVIVGLYGGSFDTGYAAELFAYDGTALSRDGDVVYVTFNTRINMLGFFDLSTFSHGYKNSGNLGFEDALCALNWVKENIRSFGGDPDNITLFGTQGGGLRIRYLIQCPAFYGLFNKVFIASGATDHGRPPEPELHRQVALEMLKTAGYPSDSVQPLKEMQLDKLVNLYKTVRKEKFPRFRWRAVLNEFSYGRTEDEGVCPQMKDMTIVVGNTWAENAFHPERSPEGRILPEQFMEAADQAFGEDKEEILQLYRDAWPERDIRDCLYYGADHRTALHTYAEAESKAGAAVYAYLFAPEMAINGGIPAYHCSDVSYWLRNIEMSPASLLREGSDRLMETCSGSLLALAKNGTPKHSGIPEWEPYTVQNRATMVFGQDTQLRKVDDRKLAELLDKHRIGH